MAGYFTRKCPGSHGPLYINGTKRHPEKMVACECGGNAEFGLFRGKVFVKCSTCPKSTGYVSTTFYDEGTLRRAWNKIASTPWREIGKGKKQ